MSNLQVEFSGNNFQTLSHRSFVLQSWNQIEFVSNRIMVMESGSILGIDVPGEADLGNNVTFVFSGNHIHYANKVNLKLLLTKRIVKYFREFFWWIKKCRSYILFLTFTLKCIRMTLQLYLIILGCVEDRSSVDSRRRRYRERLL